MIELTTRKAGVVLRVKASAAARRNEIRGEHNGSLKVSVTQVAEKGKANQAITRLLSQALGISRADIELIRGVTSAEKQFLLHGAKVTSIRKQLATLLNESA